MINRIRGVFTTTLNCFKIPELQHRIIFTVAVLFVVRLISLIPVPGLDGALLTEFLKESAAKNDNSLLGMYSLFTGGALERCGDWLSGHHAIHQRNHHHPAADCSLAWSSKMAREEGGRQQGYPDRTLPDSSALSWTRFLHVSWLGKTRSALPWLCREPGPL